MPKKTREEKMAAQLRRMKEQLGRKQYIPAKSQEPTRASQPPKQEDQPKQSISVDGLSLKTTPTTQSIKEVAERYNYAYVGSDLRKIAVLATAAVALEIVLNLTTRASFVKLILHNLGIEI